MPGFSNGQFSVKSKCSELAILWALINRLPRKVTCSEVNLPGQAALDIMSADDLQWNSCLFPIEWLPKAQMECAPRAARPILKIHENAVRLDDIPKRWYAIKEDFLPLTVGAGRRKSVWYDDVDLDFAAIHREAQALNDCSNVSKNFMWQLQQHTTDHLKRIWPELTKTQHNSLQAFINQRGRVSIDEQLTSLGYDSIINPSCRADIDMQNYAETVHNYTGVRPDTRQVFNSLAEDFCLSLLSSEVAAAYDENATKYRRKRMPYTKMFSKDNSDTKS